MSIARRLVTALAFAALACPCVRAETLVCVGVLGNSGEQGADLVRFADQPARGLGVVCDRFGALWDRAGVGRLDRYAVDGRLLGQYRIPATQDGHDQLTLVGDTLVLLLGSRLYTLPVTAAAGSEAKPLGNLEARCISFASRQGSIAAAKGDEVELVDIAGATAKRVATLRDVDSIELGGDGAIYAVAQSRAHRFSDGVESGAGWPREVNGERPQLLDGHWYTFGWHGTIRRYDAALDPSPGVVMGGASGSFIGHLDQNAELFNGRGMARLWGDLYALSGFGGVLQLAVWHGDHQQFEAVRRISAVARCPALGLDRAGDVYQRCGVWDWDARPDAPLRSGVNPPEELGQAVMLDNDIMVVPGFLWDKPSFYHGHLGGEVAIDRIDRDCVMARGNVGSAVYRDGDRTVLLTIDAKGAGHGYAIDGEGRFHGDLGAIALKPATPVAEWTSLAMKGDTLLAGGDGAVIELTRAGAEWQERKRWNSWGGDAAQRFGARIHIAADGHSLAVADGARQRVLCFDLASGQLRASFGKLDATGSDLASLDAPATVAVRGTRLVAFDAGNQRLLKLVMAP